MPVARGPPRETKIICHGAPLIGTRLTWPRAIATRKREEKKLLRRMGARGVRDAVCHIRDFMPVYYVCV